MGSPEVVRSILGAFARLPDLGLVAPQHFEAIRRWLGWNDNFTDAEMLARRMDLHLLPAGRWVTFPPAPCLGPPGGVAPVAAA